MMFLCLVFFFSIIFWGVGGFQIKVLLIATECHSLMRIHCHNKTSLKSIISQKRTTGHLHKLELRTCYKMYENMKYAMLHEKAVTSEAVYFLLDVCIGDSDIIVHARSLLFMISFLS